MDNNLKYFDDDGKEVNPNFISKPQLCLSCEKNDTSDEELVCTLTRLDQRFEQEFKCFGYENNSN